MFTLLVFAAMAIGIDIHLINMIIQIVFYLAGINAQCWGKPEPSPKVNFIWTLSFPECEAEGARDVNSYTLVATQESPILREGLLQVFVRTISLVLKHVDFLSMSGR